MRPRKPEKSATDDLFRSRLDQIIDMRHELVRLADAIEACCPPDSDAVQITANRDEVDHEQAE